MLTLSGNGSSDRSHIAGGTTQPGQLNAIRGDLTITGRVARRCWWPRAVILPTEYYLLPIGPGSEPDHRDDRDTLNLRNEGSRANDVGTNADGVDRPGHGGAVSFETLRRWR